MTKSDSELDPVGMIAKAAITAGEEWSRLITVPAFEPWQTPVATLIVASDLGDYIEISSLGDCAALLRQDGNTCAIGGMRNPDEVSGVLATGGVTSTGLDYSNTAGIAHLRTRRCQSVAEARSFSLTARCTKAVATTRFEKKDGVDVLLASDGFAALWSDYRIYSPEQIMTLASQGRLLQAMETLRRVERDDLNGRRFPRWKVSDDATAVLLRIT